MSPAFLNLTSLEKAPLKGSRVVLRLDLDLPITTNGKIEYFRLKTALPTLKKCLNEASVVTLIGHRGRPEGREAKFSLRPIAEELGRLLKYPITFVENFVKSPSVKSGQSGEKLPKLRLLENLRFWPDESKSDPQFAKILADFGDFYVNESFASAHRRSASVSALPQLLPTYFGFQFLQEVAAITEVLKNPKRPIVLVLGGAKPDKLELLPKLMKVADKVLLGGSLPQFIEKENEKMEIGTLDVSGLDLSPASINEFVQIIQNAGTVIWNGPMGKFEDLAHEAGTRLVAETIASAKGYTLAGGGDTHAALEKFGLIGQIDHLSTGGGAMLALLADGTLPALEASS